MPVWPRRLCTLAWRTRPHPRRRRGQPPLSTRWHSNAPRGRHEVPTGLDARLSCRIDVVAFVDDDAGIGGGHAAGLGVFGKAWTERSSWASRRGLADGDPSENAALAVERRLTRVAFRAVAGAYVVVDAKDVTQAPSTYLASVRVSTCQIHYHARQADVVALPKRRYGGPVPTGGRYGRRAPPPSRRDRGRQMSASSPKDKAPPSGDSVAAGLSTTNALAREKRGIVEEDGEDEAELGHCDAPCHERLELLLSYGYLALASTRHAQSAVPAGGAATRT